MNPNEIKMADKVATWLGILITIHSNRNDEIVRVTMTAEDFITVGELLSIANARLEALDRALHNNWLIDLTGQHNVTSIEALSDDLWARELGQKDEESHE